MSLEYKGNISYEYDFKEILKRAVKYIIEGIAVAVAAFLIPQKQMNISEISIIALTAAATFSILDMFAPSIGSSVRQGAGFGIGANLVGFPTL
jgi:ABC-type Co2+ transport system permease subunit